MASFEIWSSDARVQSGSQRIIMNCRVLFHRAVRSSMLKTLVFLFEIDIFWQIACLVLNFRWNVVKSHLTQLCCFSDVSSKYVCFPVQICLYKTPQIMIFIFYMSSLQGTGKFVFSVPLSTRLSSLTSGSWRRQDLETLSTFLTFCAENPAVTVGSPS